MAAELCVFGQKTLHLLVEPVKNAERSWKDEEFILYVGFLKDKKRYCTLLDN